MSRATVQPDGLPAAAKVLDWALGHALGRAPDGRAPLTPDSLMADAAKRTGLHDFGPDDFREPMEVLLSDLRATPPTALGRVLMRESFILALSNRLRIHAAAPADPVPQRPLVVVGWHRTGTTLLQELLACLPGHAHVPLYVLMEPVPRFGRLARGILATQGSWVLAHEMPVLHPQSVRGPEECWMLLMSTFQVIDFALHWPVPNYIEWMKQADLSGAYRFYARCLTLVAGEVPGTLVMKGPGHLHGLAALAESVPDARLIWTHRDPVTCAASFASLSAVHHRTMYGVYDPVRAGASAVERIGSALERGVEARSMLGDGLCDVAYANLVADPEATVERICGQFDIPFEEPGRVAVRAHMAKTRKRRKHVYTNEQWSVDPNAVRERCAEYLALDLLG